MTYNQEFRCAYSDKWQHMHDVTDKIPAHAKPVSRSDPESILTYATWQGVLCLKNKPLKVWQKRGKYFCYIVSSLHNYEALLLFKFSLIWNYYKNKDAQ